MVARDQVCAKQRVRAGFMCSCAQRCETLYMRMWCLAWVRSNGCGDSVNM